MNNEEWQKEFDTKFKGYLTLNKLGSEVFVYETDNPWELKAYIAKLLSQSHQQGRMEMAEEIEKALPKPLEKYRGFPLEADEKAVNETLTRVSTIINNLKVTPTHN